MSPLVIKCHTVRFTIIKNASLLSIHRGLVGMMGLKYLPADRQNNGAGAG